MRTRLLLAALALPLALATACGDDSSDTAADVAPTTPAASTSAGDTARSPQCTDIWQDGAKLPGGYDGCYESAKRVKPDGRYCEFGKPLVTYDQTFYAVPGGTIREAQQPFVDDPGYQDVLRKCSG